MRAHHSDTVEDYLKVIYVLTFDQGRASTNQIAERMGVTPASATGMIQRLATNEPPLLEYHKHRGVVLTPAGEKAALEVIRHHRLLEHLRVWDHLGYSPS
jgi:DtxR family Mn-dependent transcriptional regulator